MSTGDTDPEAATRTGSGAARGGWWRWLAVAGLCLVVWGGLALVWPLWEKHRAYEIVAESFEWDEKEKRATVRKRVMMPPLGMLTGLDRRTARALRVLGTKTLDISDCPRITSVAALSDIASLQEVWLSDCSGLTSVAGLPAGVQELKLWGCRSLASLADLPPGVHTLDLRHCSGLTSVSELPAGLQWLDCSDCTGVTSVAGLPPGLQKLRFDDCTELTGISQLPPGLTELQISFCTALERLGALPPHLKKVGLINTPKLPEAVKAEIRALVKKNGGEVDG